MVPAQMERVLIIGPSNIGDAILAGDVVDAVRQRFATAHLTVAVGMRAIALFKGDPRIQSLVDLDAYGTLRGRLTLALALWRYHPQVVVDLRGTAYPVLLTPLRIWRYLRRAPQAVRHRRARYHWMLLAQVPELRSVAPAGAPRGLWSAQEAAHVERLVQRWGVPEGHPLVVICPGARSLIKRWTVEGFSRVADRLIEACGVQVVFSGEASEEPFIREILEGMHHPAHSAVGLATIRQVGVLMARAVLVITNDSASLHLASTIGIPTVAIFGPTDPAKYGPTVEPHLVIRRRLFCSPCEQPGCRFSHECMRFIQADEVYEAARTLLARAGDRPAAQGRERAPLPQSAQLSKTP